MKAARAAADYLSFLYDTFGSWPLALAAYNSGEKAVRRALDQSGLTTFWGLAETGYLPAETCDYVPKFFAAVKIIRDPGRYSFYFDPQPHVPGRETVSIPGGVKFSWLENRIGVSQSSLEDCNPELCQPVTPPGCSNYELCVPFGKGEAVLSALEDRPMVEEKPAKIAARPAPNAPSAPPPLLLKTRSGDTWATLARKGNCTAKTLAALNGAIPSREPRAGLMISLPGGERSATTSKNKIEEKASARNSGMRNADSTRKSVQLIHYPVHPKDSLWSIAERFQIPVETLCTQNNLKPNQKLVPGCLLTIRGKNLDSVAMQKKRVD